MKVFLFVVLMALCSFTTAQSLPLTPTLYKLQNFTFAAPYSCGGNYQHSALFLSSESQLANSPDLLLNGACGNVPYFQIATSGSDLGYIEIYGLNTPLSSLSAQDLQNPKNLFSINANVQVGHTYGITGSKQEFRYILGVTVNSLNPNGSLDITYAVYLYEVHQVVDQSPGFNWLTKPQ